jgi:Zn finger protein HypA/HybF involved in hydrogenase expression
MGYIKKPELPRPKPIKRTCLKCGREFVAEGRFNRICERCTESNRQVTLGSYIGWNEKAEMP